MRKRVELITVVIRAEFGVDLNDPFDRDDNAYLNDSGHENIAAAIAAGDIVPGNRAYLELNTGDVVSGELVSIAMQRAGDVAVGPDAAIRAEVVQVSTDDQPVEDVGEDHLA